MIALEPRPPVCSSWRCGLLGFGYRKNPASRRKTNCLSVSPIANGHLRLDAIVSSEEIFQRELHDSWVLRREDLAECASTKIRCGSIPPDAVRDVECLTAN